MWLSISNYRLAKCLLFAEPVNKTSLGKLGLQHLCENVYKERIPIRYEHEKLYLWKVNCVKLNKTLLQKK